MLQNRILNFILLVSCMVYSSCSSGGEKAGENLAVDGQDVWEGLDEILEQINPPEFRDKISLLPILVPLVTVLLTVL